ncbi:MAG: FlgD immunoglobulin-like domain containing protein [Armatimonadota bacterium]|nr:FlgD immunoglobulin-like domain containing protein [Armatimonadota bacterium]
MRARKVCVQFVLLTLTLLAPASAQLIEERIIARGEVPGFGRSYVFNNYVYVTTSKEVMLGIYEFSTSTPMLRGRLNYPGNTYGFVSAILVDGGYAYISYESASGSGNRLAVVNVSNPASPAIVGELTFAAADPVPISIAKVGNYLYLFAYQRDISVVDVSNPANPSLVRRVSATASAGVVVGNRLYTAEGPNGVRIYDISQPANPTLVNTINSVSNIGRVAVANGRLYALRSYGPPLQLHIFDLSNPDSPTLVHTYPTERVAGLAAVGDFVLLSGYGSGTEVVNVSNPSAPSQVRVLLNHEVQNADPISGRVLIQGQSILLLYNPASEHSVSVQVPYPLKALRHGNFVYSVDETRIVAYDISNLSQPLVHSSAPLVRQRTSGTDFALISSNHLAVSTGGVLQIFEHTGASLIEVARNDTGASGFPGFSDRVRISGNRLAMCVGGLGGAVQLYDVSNPAAPTPGQRISGSTGKFEIVETLLYDVKAGFPPALRIFDVANLSAPNQIGSAELPSQLNSVSDVAVGAGYVLIADMQGKLALIDARNPNSPQVAAQHTLSGISFPRVAFDGTAGAFYVYDGWNRKVFVFRVSDLPNLTPAATITLNREMYTLSFYQDQVFGAGRGEGLILYRNTLFGGPVVVVTGISPNQGANRGRLSVTIIGTGFAEGATVRLERGNQQILATEVRFISDSRLEAVFEFNGEPENTAWDVVVRNPDNREGRLTNGFSIVEAVPSIVSITPDRTLPLSQVTIDIQGSLFVPEAQVVLLPPHQVSVNPIVAQVAYLSQNRLRATFNLAPYQALELLSFGVESRLVVRHPDNRESNAVTLTIVPPRLRIQNLPRSVTLPSDATTLTIEAEVLESTSNEPIRFLLWSVQAGQRVERAPERVEFLGDARWRLTFATQSLIPDNLANNWSLEVHQLGTKTSEVLTLYRPYAARAFGTVETNNLQEAIEFGMELTNDSPEVRVVLRQGDRVIEPTQVQRFPDNWRVGVTRLFPRFPIRMEDVGTWSVEVRYDANRVVVLPEVVRVQRGRLVVQSAEWVQPYTVFGTLQARIKVHPRVEDWRAVLRIPAWSALERTEIAPTRITYDAQNNAYILEFDNAETLVARPTYAELILQHPLLEPAHTYLYDAITPGTIHAYVSIGVPVGYRAGRWITLGYIDIRNDAPYPETPYIEIPLPLRDSVLQSGQFRAEYRVRESYSGEVVASGTLNLSPDPEDHTIRALLKPVLPQQWQYYVLEVRFVPTGRNAPPTTSLHARSPQAIAFVVVGATVLLAFLGYQLLDATCDSTIIAAAIQRRIQDELMQSDLSEGIAIPSQEEILRVMRILYDDTTKKGFVQSVLEEVVRQRLQRESEQKLKQFIKPRIAGRLRTHLPGKDSSFYESAADQIASGMITMLKGQISYKDFLKLFFGSVVSGLPATVAEKAVEVMLRQGKGCLEKVEKLRKIYTNRFETRQRADVGFSYDPNEKIGAGGMSGYIRPDDTIFYEIKFENLATATAGAEEVLIEDVLPEGLDLNSLEFVAVQVGTHQRLLPAGTTALNLDIDMRPERPVIVQIRSALDTNTRTLRVRYKGIDPNTGNHYEQGFLPPNQNPPQGEGSVTFRIRPLSNTPSGTQFVNRATIIFDPHLGINPPIVTNAHTLTLDSRPPTVAVQVPAASVPETKARLSWQATDDASGVEEVEIWTQEGTTARRIGRAEASGERTESGTVQVRARRFGEETRILARATDRVGNTTPLGDEPIATIRMGQAPSFSAGLHLLGIPLRPDATDMQPIFGFQNNQWATYNPATGQYVQYPDANAAPAIGRGFWVVLPSAVQPNLVGDLPDPEQRFSIDLQPGWNLIANPWTEALVWHREAVRVRVQGVARPLSQATEFVEPYLWGWEPNPSNPQRGRYVLVSDAQILPGMQTTLQPWQGYWIYAKQPCTLELPTPEQAALFAGLTRSYQFERNGGWSFRIGAQLGDAYDEVLLGVSGDERGLQVAMPPDPPTRAATAAAVQLRLVREGVPYEADVQPKTRRATTWTLELHVPPAEDDQPRTLLLTVPDVARLPRGVNPVLRDTQTGERRLLRNSAAWQIAVPREGLTRTYEVSLVSTSRLLRITGLQIQSSRSTGQHTLQFTLSDEARVSIVVLAGNQVVRTLEQGRSRSRGVQQAVWDGRDVEGRALPPGTYQIVVQAETDDGQVARASIPLVLTR